jgi:hypothetical protein
MLYEATLAVAFFMVRQAWRVASCLALFRSLWWWLDDLAVKVRYRPDKGNG